MATTDIIDFKKNYVNSPVVSSFHDARRDIPEILTEYGNIKSAILLNEVMCDKLKRLESLLQQRLVECQYKLKKVRDGSYSEHTITKRHYNNSFKYISPYFKDSQNSEPPENENTLFMKKCHMYIHYKEPIKGWTVKDKMSCNSVLHSMSRKIKYNALIAKRELSSEKYDMNIKLIDNMKFEDLCLPINEEYNWENVAKKLLFRHSAQEYRNMWKLYLHPSINKKTWTKTEHEKLKNLAIEHKLQNWDIIAQELSTNRSCYQCFIYYQTTINKTHNNRKWSKEEDDNLQQLVEYYKHHYYIPWGLIASRITNRTKIQIYNRWHCTVKPGIRKGRFLPDEDNVLLACVKIYGTDFKKISEYIPGRSMAQLRTRYNILGKNSSAVWTVEEDKRLVLLIANQGSTTKYVELVKHFPGKDRANLRIRHITLKKWMKRNPTEDIALAPRKGTRNLCHGKLSKPLTVAVENLNDQLINQVEQGRKNKSCRDKVINSIIFALYNELNKKDETHTVNLERMTEDAVKPDCIQRHAQNLQKELILYRAIIDGANFKYTNYIKKYPNIFSMKVNTYSKVNKTNIIDKAPNIWGQTLVGPSIYVLPPNFATITGCKLLLLSCQKSVNHKKSVTAMCKSSMKFNNEWTILLNRFKTLFMWPLMLSNTGPDESV